MSKNIKVGDWVRVSAATSNWFGQEFKVTEVVTTDFPGKCGKRFANGDKQGAGVWFRFLEKIDPPKPALDFVADARATLLNSVFEYRKELIAILDSGSPDARPIVQAKLSAVNEIIARLNSGKVQA